MNCVIFVLVVMVVVGYATCRIDCDDGLDAAREAIHDEMRYSTNE